MRVFEYLDALLAYPLRTTLSILGVVIGVAALVATIAIGSGAKAAATQGISELGANLLFVRPGKARMGYAWLGNVETLTLDDTVAMQALPEISSAVPEVFSRVQVKYRNRNTDSRVFGVTHDYLDILQYKVAAGAPFTAADVKTRRMVALLGAKAAQALFHGEDPVGKWIKIKGKNFLVLGLLKERGERAGLMEADDRILVPVTTYQKRLFGGDLIRSIMVRVNPTSPINKVMADMTRALRQRHRIAPGMEDDFHITSQTEVLATMGMVSQIFSRLLGSVAAITLLVGGVGVMNIMLVAVTERTREIGLRMAMGATRKHIREQFLTESVAIALTGGILGIVIGMAGGSVMANMAGWRAVFSAWAFLVPLASSAGLGLLFGLYPALKAARLDPAEALRHG